MNSRIFRLLAAVLVSTIFSGGAVADSGLKSLRVIENTGSFALGGVGVAGTMSAGERALCEVLERTDAVFQLQAVLPTASPAGKLYALLGLRIRDRAAYERALEKCRTIDAKVETARGCILMHESFPDLVKEIERGQYDSFLAREWPKEAR
jgi:hypothetical protein